MEGPQLIKDFIFQNVPRATPASITLFNSEKVGEALLESGLFTASP